MGKIRGKISSLRIRKGGKKFPWTFLQVKQCRKKNVENYKKLEKNGSIKLFRYKVREICQHCCLYSAK